MLLKHQTVKMKNNDVWSESKNENCLIGRGKYHNNLLNNDDRSLSISRNISSNLKDNFQK